MRRFNPEKELSKIRNGSKKKVIISICALLVVGILGYSFALYQVRHTQKLVFNTVGEFKKRDIYLSVLVDGEYKNDFPTKSDDMLYGGYECDGNSKINFDTDKWQVALYASHPDKCTIKFGHKYVDQSGANYPELYQGMIPVYFENGKIYVADITSEWYNYDENKWANAVLIDYANKKDKFYDDNGNLLGGHEVSEEDILQMYVWIPRYKYQLWNVNNEDKVEQVINIKFEEGTANSGDITCTYNNLNNGTIEEKCVNKNTQIPVQNNEWYTHLAFKFGNTELKGIWVGKFEPSETNINTSSNILANTANSPIDDIIILPNKISIVNRNVSTMFNATRKIEAEQNKYSLLSTQIDTHMMKNIEWGAVAYLSQSKYGIFNTNESKITCIIDSSLDEHYCKTWINNTSHGNSTNYDGTITGCSGNSADAGIMLNTSACENNHDWKNEGVKASTTGNIYGVYDMSGGMWEYVMGNVVNVDGSFYNNAGFQEKDGIYINSKYYDSYEYSSEQLIFYRGHLGDSTREILKNHLYENGGWYSSWLHFPYGTSHWFHRGGHATMTSVSRIFSSSRQSGAAAHDTSFRVVLTAQDGTD